MLCTRPMIIPRKPQSTAPAKVADQICIDKFDVGRPFNAADGCGPVGHSHPLHTLQDRS